jgi:hypothetical protein
LLLQVAKQGTNEIVHLRKDRFRENEDASVCWLASRTSRQLNGRSIDRQFEPNQRLIDQSHCGTWGFDDHELVALTKVSHRQCNRMAVLMT